MFSANRRADSDPGNRANCNGNAATSAAAGNATLTLTGTSAALSHSLPLSNHRCTPSPDFTLAVLPTSLTVVTGAAGSPVSVAATAVNRFRGTVAVATTGLPVGVTAQPAT